MSKSQKRTAPKRFTAKRDANWPPQSVLAPGDGFLWSREVVFDLHNTLVNWTERFAEYCNLQFGHSIDASKQRFYHMQFDPSNGLTDAEFLAAFIAFARRSEGGYGDLKPYDNVVADIAKIKAAGIGVKIWTWTPGAAETRIDNGAGAYETGIAQSVTKTLVAKLGIDPDRDLRFMKPGEKKYKMFAEHIPLIVEDSAETAVGVASGAHAAILVPEPYNEGVACPNLIRLDHRGQIAPTVIEFYKKLEAAGVLL